MARPERNNIDYFPHLVIHGKKMHHLREKFGNDGYAVWFMLLEELGKADFHYLNLSDDIQLMYLSSQFKISEILLKEIINTLVKMGNFDSDLWKQSLIIYDQKFVDSIEDAYSKRQNNCINKNELLLLLQSLGVYKPSKLHRKPSKLPLKGSINPQSKVEDSKVNNIPKKHSFPLSLFYEKEKWCDRLKDWPKEKSLEYWERAFEYSGSKGEKYLDWSLAVRAWDRKKPWIGKSKKSTSGNPTRVGNLVTF